mmetsp:Transcript_45904/g.109335  ORF Transcript_45904/g.109335 Transcript_45904/m.109335 type:complete len:268 (-) Transcript_45904:43-846(-)
MPSLSLRSASSSGCMVAKSNPALQAAARGTLSATEWKCCIAKTNAPPLRNTCTADDQPSSSGVDRGVDRGKISSCKLLISSKMTLTTISIESDASELAASCCKPSTDIRWLAWNKRSLKAQRRGTKPCSAGLKSTVLGVLVDPDSVWAMSSLRFSPFANASVGKSTKLASEDLALLPSCSQRETTWATSCARCSLANSPSAAVLRRSRCSSRRALSRSHWIFTSILDVRVAPTQVGGLLSDADGDGSAMAPLVSLSWELAASTMERL